MKLIHHKLENGNADPIEIEFKMGNDQYPADVLSDLLQYLSEAMEDKSYNHPMTGLDFSPAENHSSKVFLFTSGLDEIERAEVVVSNKPASIIDAYKKWIAPCDFDSFPTNVFHLQEYSSFQEAYEVAFYIREGHPLAYPSTND